MKLSESDGRIIAEALAHYRSSEQVQSMRHFISHGSISTLEHCEHVVTTCYFLNKHLHLHADLESLLVCALLHDLYLYDWHDPDANHKWHGFHHAKKAAENAAQYFNLSQQEITNIRTHMWPLNITSLPKSREGWLLCLADKYCALWETMHLR